jgi:hypothetical protein
MSMSAMLESALLAQAAAQTHERRGAATDRSKIPFFTSKFQDTEARS